jgi:glycosyltransferase involved in cell wall biosynthesis
VLRLGRIWDAWVRRRVQSIPPPAVKGAGRTRVVDIELSRPLAPLEAAGWSSAHLVVRLHGQPLGTVDVDLSDGPVTPAVRDIVEAQLNGPVQRHLRADGIDRVDQTCAPGHLRHRCLEALEPPAPAPLVTVVIPTHNRAEQLRICLGSILHLTYPALEVVVVDNAPSDSSTRDMVMNEFAFDPRIRYVHVARAGASRARNIGAQLANGEFIAFTDDDAVVDPLWVSGLIAGFRADPRVACVTGLTLPASLETAAEQAFELFGGMGLGFEPRVFDLQENRGVTLLYPYTAGFGASNNVAFRRRDFFALGGFDVTLGPATPTFGAEDLDLLLAAILAGHRIAYQPSASVRHRHRENFPELYWQAFTYSAGMTALLTKLFLSDRRIAADLARRVPKLLPAAFLQSHRSGEELGVGRYPQQIRWLERLGYLYGPVAYLRSRLAARDSASDVPAAELDLIGR